MSPLRKLIICIVFVFFIGTNIFAEIIKPDDVGVTFEIPWNFTFFLSEDEIL